MRPDQLIRLQALSEKLADAFIEEADPDGWTSNQKFYDRKIAMATGGVLRYTLDLIQHHARRCEAARGPGEEARESDLDVKIRRAEAEAAAAMDRVLVKAKARAPHGPIS